ncbi:MinD/ParA family ATP-binding protein [Embleya sp. MST-111070]|uniref:MinD/ParA family ATP-binding protein n=1 Tax=Embleya sp. MST-111070 TaxID=3398231 RepID=UPI003F73CDEA
MSETVSLAGRRTVPVSERDSAGSAERAVAATPPAPPNGASVSPTAPAAGGTRPVPKGLPMSAYTHAVWTAMAGLPARAPVVALTAPAGGVGVSTVTAALGALLALAAPEAAPPLAIDAGTRAWSGLPARVGPPGEATFNDLLAREGSEAMPHHEARAFTHQGPTGLEMLAGESRPGGDGARPPMTAGALYRVLTRLRGAYPLVLVDAPAAGDAVCEQALRRSTTAVLVARASSDGTEHALAFLAWLRSLGHDRLVDGAVVVVNEVAPGPPREVRAGERVLARQVRAVVRLPYDRELAKPEPVRPTALGKAARGALLEIAAAVVAGWESTASAQAGPTTSKETT